MGEWNGLPRITKVKLTRDGSGILGGLSLSVVEVGGDGDDGVRDLFAEISFGDFLHFGQDHGGDFLGREGLLLATDGDLDLRLVALVDHLRSQKRRGLQIERKEENRAKERKKIDQREEAKT